MQRRELMTGEQRLDAAGQQLGFVLQFFPRVEAKMSVILYLNIGMLGILSGKAPAFASISPFGWTVVALFFVTNAMSLVQLYLGSFPTMKDVAPSLTFFRDIARREEAEFVEAFGRTESAQLADDLLCQSWRNSTILAAKFKRLRGAYWYTALSALPWSMAIASFSAR